jgi:hypothetical protein
MTRMPKGVRAGNTAIWFMNSVLSCGASPLLYDLISSREEHGNHIEPKVLFAARRACPSASSAAVVMSTPTRRTRPWVAR